MTVIRGIGDVAAFAAELGMLATLGYAGWRLEPGRVARGVLAAIGVAAGVTVWAVFFAAGGHPVTLPRAVEAIAKFALFAFCVAILNAAGRRRAALVLAVVALIGLAVEYL